MAENVSTMDSKQYIIVELGNEQYGIDIQYIDNIVRMQRITRVPKAQSYFKGVINLRGEIVPVMSIRKKMGLADDEITDKLPSGTVFKWMRSSNVDDSAWNASHTYTDINTITINDNVEEDEYLQEINVNKNFV